MTYALKSLIQTPQNNFRIFKNGTLIFGEDHIQDIRQILLQFFNPKKNDCER